MKNFKRWIKMQVIPSTYKFLALKFFNGSVDERWSDWAVDMMQVGFDTESLPMLALLEKPYNQFELKELTDKIFDELGLDYTDKDFVITRYVHYMLDEAIAGRWKLINVLRELRNLYYELDDGWLFDFYLLYFAKEDLTGYGFTTYWNGATQANIDDIIISEFKKWKLENPIQDE